MRVADVEAIVVAARKNTVWQLADMLADRKRAAALAFLDNLLREGEQPIGIVGALAWLYRKLIEARGLARARRMASRQRASSACVQMRPRMRCARRIAFRRRNCWRDWWRSLRQTAQLKSSNPDPRAIMEFLVAQLTMRSTA